MRKHYALGLGLLSLALALSAAAGPVLKRNDRLAIAGDSITEQRQYSRFIADYLAVCRPDLNIDVASFGWGGERAIGFLARMSNDLSWFQPNVVTVCYGMNDGNYAPFVAQIGDAYLRPLTGIVSRLAAEKALVILGSPGCVDTRYFKRPAATAEQYNETLRRLRDLAEGAAQQSRLPFADVFSPMTNAMFRAKAVLGADYDIAGIDGVHPKANGHLVMAYAFLRALGLDGTVGVFRIHWPSGQASASDGHKVLAFQNGRLDLESTRYPFCFTGAEKSSDGTLSILPFVPFNEELNRFILQVNGLPWASARITWGATNRVFTREQLALGVNLAAEFPANPFCEPFRRVDAALLTQQTFETLMIRQLITSIPLMVRSCDNDAKLQETLFAVKERLILRRAGLAAAARRAVQPVRHTLIIAKGP